MTIRKLAVLGTPVLVTGSTIAAQDWPQWRGANRDGVATFTEPAAWPEMLTQRWKVDLGPGYATPLIVGNRVYI